MVMIDLFYYINLLDNNIYQQVNYLLIQYIHYLNIPNTNYCLNLRRKIMLFIKYTFNYVIIIIMIKNLMDLIEELFLYFLLSIIQAHKIL